MDADVTAHADLVFTGGRAFCADAGHSFVDAVAVRAGRIVAVGSDDVQDLVGPGTERVDLAGAAVADRKRSGDLDNWLMRLRVASVEKC